MVTGCVNDIAVQGLICTGDITKDYLEETYLPLVGGTIDGSLSVGNTIDYVHIDASGDLKLMGSASQWVDLTFPATQTKLGANSKPDTDYTNVGLLFPQNDESEKVYMLAQFNHDRKNGSNVSPHIHYIQDETSIPTFKMEYRWYENGSAIPNWTTIESSTAIFNYIGVPMMQIIEFADINGSGIDTVSSMMDLIVYRKTGDGIAGDVLVKEFDIHYEVDSFGSNSEYIK